jgi:GT2 family glycosyltransferase
MSKSKIITAIVPTFARLFPLCETIKSVKDALEFSKVEYQIIIVDNNSDRSYIEFVKKVSTDYNCEYIKSNQNGPCHARNLATAKFSDSLYYSFLDDDIYVYLDYFINALEIFHERNEIDIINGRTLNSSPSFTNFVLGPFKDLRNSKSSIDNIWHVSGGNFLAKNIVVNNIKFDENYFGYSYAEDLDYGYRATKFGYKVNYSPKIKMLHFSSKEGRDTNNECLEKIIGFSYFWKKNFNSKYKLFYLVRVFLFILKSSSFDLKLYFKIIYNALNPNIDPKFLFEFKKHKK